MHVSYIKDIDKHGLVSGRVLTTQPRQFRHCHSRYCGLDLRVTRHQLQFRSGSQNPFIEVKAAPVL
jgi:hypothetical protein